MNDSSTDSAAISLIRWRSEASPRKPQFAAREERPLPEVSTLAPRVRHSQVPRGAPSGGSPRGRERRLVRSPPAIPSDNHFFRCEKRLSEVGKIHLEPQDLVSCRRRVETSSRPLCRWALSASTRTSHRHKRYRHNEIRANHVVRIDISIARRHDTNFATAQRSLDFDPIAPGSYGTETPIAGEMSISMNTPIMIPLKRNPGIREENGANKPNQTRTISTRNGITPGMPGRRRGGPADARGFTLCRSMSVGAIPSARVVLTPRPSSPRLPLAKTLRA